MNSSLKVFQFQTFYYGFEKKDYVQLEWQLNMLIFPEIIFMKLESIPFSRLHMERLIL